MKKILLLCACIWALTTPLRAVAGPPVDIVVVRIYELNSSDQLIITRGEGKSETVEIKRGTSEKTRIQSSEGYYKVLQSLYQEGYTLQNTFSVPGYETLVFTKVKAQ